MKLIRCLCACSAIFALIGACFAAEPSAAKKPNIIMVLCDDLGYGDIGIWFQNQRKEGQPQHKTPNIDVLANEGIQLRAHYCGAPVCAPSRATLLTGQNQGHANVRDNQFDKALEDNHTLGSVMRQAGYATAAFGKWGLQGDGKNAKDWPAHPLKRGFDYYYGYITHGAGHFHYPKEDNKEVYEDYAEVSDGLKLCYTTDLFTARTKKWIVDQKKNEPAKPFFIYLAYDTPHAILQYPPCAYPTGGGLNGGLQWTGTKGAMINTATGVKDSYIFPDYQKATFDDDNNPQTPEVIWPEIFQRYATSVRRIDQAMGDLMQLLKDLSIDRDTLVVFTTDNGPSTESYLKLKPAYTPQFFDNYGPFEGIKRDVWEGGVRVGAIAHWPSSIPAGVVTETPTGFWDWLATFTDAAGIPGPARTNGVSLLPLLTGKGKQRPSNIYIEYDQNGKTPDYAEFMDSRRGRARNQMQVVQLDGFKGVRYDIEQPQDPFEIYQVTKDPKERMNLANSPELAELQARLQNRVGQTRRPDSGAPRPYDGIFVAPVVLKNSVPGKIAWAQVLGEWPWVPDLAGQKSAAKGVSSGFVLPDTSEKAPGYAVVFAGFFTAPKNGEYRFELTDDSGAVLWLHEARVIDDDFGHTGAMKSGSIRLQAGTHPIRLYYRHVPGKTPSLNLSCSGPDLPLAPIGETLLVQGELTRQLPPTMTQPSTPKAPVEKKKAKKKAPKTTSE